MADNDSFLTVEYRLPVTSVRFKGAITELVDGLDKPKITKSVDAAAALDVRADPRTRYTLTVRDRDLVKLNMGLKFLSDGRMSSSSAEVDDQSAAQLTAALSVGAATTTGLLQVLAGAGAPGVAASVVGGLVVGGATALRARFNIDALETIELSDSGLDELVSACLPESTESRPSPKEVGIDERFRKAQPAAFDVLHRYRVALLYLAHAHAETAEEAHRDPVESARTLRSLDRALASTRAEASRVEEIYRVWREGHITRQVEHVDEQLYVDALPTTSDFRETLRNPPATDDGPLTWWPVARRLRLMMTCDLLDEQPGEQFDGESDYSDGTLVHRVPMNARLTTWRLRRDDARDWIASPERVDWILISHPRGTRSIQLPLQRDTDSKVAVEFDATGALISIEANTTGQLLERNEALAAMPGALSGAATAVGTALSPATRAAALKARVEEEEQRAKLQGLLNPSPDNLAKLKKELAEAELSARLAVANHLRSDPSSVFVIASTPDE